VSRPSSTIDVHHGVFPIQRLRQAAEQGVIRSESGGFEDRQFQPSSIDLRLGSTAHMLQCSFVPGRAEVREQLGRYSLATVDLSAGATLERNRPYLIPLVERLRLPSHVWSKTSPKSSTGRLDVFTRIICDGSARFDEQPLGYEGQLYLELFSRTFSLRVTAGQSLAQIRLCEGSTRCESSELEALHERAPVGLQDGRPVPPSQLEDGSLLLSVDLAPAGGGPVAYRAKRHAPLVDLARLGAHAVSDYWEAVDLADHDRLILDPEEFYLLMSTEGVAIPSSHCAEMSAYEPNSGEIRTHYAGFFDPGFGVGLSKGARAVMEVRAHDVPFALEHGQRVCRLQFERLTDPTELRYGSESASSNYQGQALWLGKHFAQRPDRKVP